MCFPPQSHRVASPIAQWMRSATGRARSSRVAPNFNLDVLRQRDHRDVTVVGEGWENTLGALRAEAGKDIWLFGGGSLLRSLLDVGLVDTIEIAVIPVLLGGGIPLLPSPAKRTQLKLTSHKIYRTGIVSLEYALKHPH